MAKKEKVLCVPPFKLRINETNTSASLWDSNGWFLGWIGCKNLKYKYQQNLFWKQIETRLNLNDKDLNYFSHSAEEGIDINTLKKYKEVTILIEQHNLTVEQVESLLSVKRQIDSYIPFCHRNIPLFTLFNIPEDEDLSEVSFFNRILEIKDYLLDEFFDRRTSHTLMSQKDTQSFFSVVCFTVNELIQEFSTPNNTVLDVYNTLKFRFGIREQFSLLNSVGLIDDEEHY